MQQPGTDTWYMPDALQTETLLAALSAEFGIERAPEYAATVIYTDTFDWRLYQRGYLLHCHGGCWTLYHGDSDEITVQQGGPVMRESCRAKDFPPGPLRELLEPLLGIRCLLPLTSVRLGGRQVRLLNQDGKTVARLVLENQQPVGGQLFPLIRLFGIRGYSQEESRVRQVLTTLGICQTASPLIGFEEGCRASGRRPLDYSSKFALELDPDSPSRQSMARIYLALLDNIDRNIPGVLADWDTEFLHDLRVAIRRTRSGLSLVKKVLPDTVVDRFTKAFSRLGTLTGPTRDLDVYLLNRETYVQRLAPTLQPGLLLFFAELERRRQIEQKKLVRVLRAKTTRNVLASWRRTLRSRDRQPAPLAEMPTVEVASRIIRKRFKRVLKDGRALDASTPDPEVHRLRIQCKKLRYAMEFFSALYPKQDMQGLLRHLKKLQDILGSFNDLSVQQEMLRTTMKKVPTGSQRHLEQAAALGGLMQSLYQEQQELRGHFVEAFEQFGDPATTALFLELFQNKQGIS